MLNNYLTNSNKKDKKNHSVRKFHFKFQKNIPGNFQNNINFHEENTNFHKNNIYKV